ncbi:hypothetical protein COT75_03675 [Candidatus Beckwithbacteria bacterium CG10_big_fil_rev_8_21_14_0_10_34_10]|uniref:AI-2E family transporter n=1 Tax=Candidatus Beckwithbacteria bacterium CG10_big_fil_rev_8_21_14_0_10_34_10 TaxID=1974495 RepID=A0A2H0W8H5_9BACT|nr:MAG: hypothetical protein COT75_03675 [Candidatus Beckwithbacteria bacterium CG10_big_fil_rev_8_21_14_0_10_34_10]
MQKIEVSYKSFFTFFLFIAGFFLLYQIRAIILFLFISLIVTAALSPMVDKLEKLKLPRALSIFLLYILIFGGFIFAIASSIPALVKQTSALIDKLPEFLNTIGYYKLNLQPADYKDQITVLTGNALKIMASVFNNVIQIFAFMVVTFYLLMERRQLKKHLHFLFYENGEQKAEQLILALERKLGGWVRGELILMVIVGLMSFVGLGLLGVEFALPLAILAGFLELIPNLGPTIALIPAVIIGFSVSNPVGLGVLALYILIQQLENNLIVPKVMKKSVGLHPLVTLVALMVGFKIGGIGGGLLAVPAALFIEILIKFFYSSRRRVLH